ncbi:hypothetical protein K449DRAFT_381910 [Hypoxylon sp. EC38]|nr:hypothetical protein K449DRAFT_381910 [Hypoxylon sp. EC38]
MTVPSLVQLSGLSVTHPHALQLPQRFHQQNISGQMCFFDSVVAIAAVVLQYPYERPRPISYLKATPAFTKPRLYGWYAKTSVVVETFVLPGTIP